LRKQIILVALIELPIANRNLLLNVGLSIRLLIHTDLACAVVRDKAFAKALYVAKLGDLGEGLLF
jgi:hypothetical protein